MKPIAIVTDYLGLIRAFRARVVELGISYETLDQVAGWSDRYASKLLAEEPPRRFGPMAFDAALGALALKLLVVPDHEQLRYIKRNRYFVKRGQPARMPSVRQHTYVVHRITAEHLRQMRRNALTGYMKKVSPAKRRMLARNAAKARWRKAELK